MSPLSPNVLVAPATTKKPACTPSPKAAFAVLMVTLDIVTKALLVTIEVVVILMSSVTAWPCASMPLIVMVAMKVLVDELFGVQMRMSNAIGSGGSVMSDGTKVVAALTSVPEQLVDQYL